MTSALVTAPPVLNPHRPVGGGLVVVVVVVDVVVVGGGELAGRTTVTMSASRAALVGVNTSPV